MFGRILGNIWKSDVGKVVTTLGGILTIKYTYTWGQEVYDNKLKSKRRFEDIKNINLTDDDIEYYKKEGVKRGQELTEQEMKELKHEQNITRKKQLLYRDEEKINDMFSEDYKPKKKSNENNRD